MRNGPSVAPLAFRIQHSSFRIMSLTAVILAAGQSKRMKSSLPKPLHPVCGRPMLGYILDAAYDAGADKVVVVVGHAKEQVIDAFNSDDRIAFVEQTERLGTGHAVMTAVPALPSEGDVVVLAGDLPLIRGESLKQLVSEHRNAGAAISMATAKVRDPFGYGRVIRDEGGHFVKIVEQADATPEEAAVNEVFPSITMGTVKGLTDALGKLSNDNAQGEYYFTDVFEITKNGGGRVLAVSCIGPDDIVAPNTRAQLADAGRVMQRRILDAHYASGVGIPHPEAVVIEHGAQIGQDATILPFSFVGRNAAIGAGCTVGPFAYVAADAVVAEGESVAGNPDRAAAMGGLA